MAVCDADMICEADVVRIWLAGAFRRDALRTEDGRRVEIGFAGVPGTGAGPDIRGARIRLDGREAIGDVEVHMRTGGWHEHGHRQDGAYQNVILHVVFRRDPNAREVLRPFGSDVVPELVLSDYLEEAPAALAARLRQCAGETTEPGPTREDLRAAGRQRLEERAARLRRLWDREDPEEVLWREFLTALGYRANKATFRQFARILPWARMRALPVPVEEAMLIAAARITWVRFGVRPQNFPEVRIRACVPLVERARRCGWRALVWEAVGDLEALARPVGRSRAQAIAWSVWAPAALVMARARNDAERERLVLAEFCSRPAFGRDRLIRWGTARWGITGALSAAEAEGLRVMVRRRAASV